MKLVDFTVRPHMDADYFPTATASNMKRWAAKVKEPLYAFHDDTAIKVVDGQIEVVSEDSWHLFNDGPNVAAIKRTRALFSNGWSATLHLVGRILASNASGGG